MPPPTATENLSSTPNSTDMDNASTPQLTLALLTISRSNVCLFRVFDTHHQSAWLFTATPSSHGLTAAAAAVADALASLPAPQQPTSASHIRRIKLNAYTLHKGPAAWIAFTDHVHTQFPNATIDSKPVSTGFYRRIELVANRIIAASGIPTPYLMDVISALLMGDIATAAQLRPRMDLYFTPTTTSRMTHMWTVASLLATSILEPTPAILAQFLGKADTRPGRRFLDETHRASFPHCRNPTITSLNCVLTLAHSLWLLLHGNPRSRVLKNACLNCLRTAYRVKPFATDLPPRTSYHPANKTIVCTFCARSHPVFECPAIRALYPHPCPDLSRRAMDVASTVTNPHGQNMLGHPSSARAPMLCTFACYDRHEKTTRPHGHPPPICPALAYGRPRTIHTICAQRSHRDAVDRSSILPDNDRPNDHNNVATPCGHAAPNDHDESIPARSFACNETNRRTKRPNDKPGPHPSRPPSDISSEPPIPGPSAAPKNSKNSKSKSAQSLNDSALAAALMQIASSSPPPARVVVSSAGHTKTKTYHRQNDSPVPDSLQQGASALCANAAPFDPRAHKQHPGPPQADQADTDFHDARPRKVTFAPSLISPSSSSSDSSPPSLVSDSPPSLIAPSAPFPECQPSADFPGARARMGLSATPLFSTPSDTLPHSTPQGIPVAYEADPADEVLRQTHGDISMSLAGQPYPETTSQTIRGSRSQVAPIFQSGLCVRASVASRPVDFLVDGGQAFNSIAADQITALRHSMPEREFNSHVQLFVQGNKPPPGHPLAHPIFRKRDCALITIHLGAIGRAQLPFFVTGPEWPGGNGIGRNALQAWGADLSPCDTIFPDKSCQCGSTWHLGYTRFGAGQLSYRVIPAFPEDEASLFRPWVAPRD